MRTRLLLLPLLLAGCSDTSPPLSEPTQVPTSALATASPGPTATASPVPRPSPTATTRRAARDRDVDGDGRADTITPTEGRLSVTLSSTGQVVTASVTAETPGVPALLGTSDIDLDGRVEVFLETARGASTTFATPYRFDGERLRELQLDGDPARLGMGGTVTHGDGFRCRPDGLLEVLSAESADGERFTVTSTTYRLTSTDLVQVRRTSSTGKQGDPSVGAAFTADCGAVTASEP